MEQIVNKNGSFGSSQSNSTKNNTEKSWYTEHQQKQPLFGKRRRLAH